MQFSGEIDWYPASIGVPMVTMSRSGIALNEAAIVALKEAPYVEVGMTKDRDYLVIAPLMEETRDAIVFSSRKRDVNGRISINNRDLARGFIETRIGSPLDRATRLPAILDEESGWLIVDLIGCNREGYEDDEEIDPVHKDE